MFHFRGPSNVGDQLVLKSIVNNAFKDRWVSTRQNQFQYMAVMLRWTLCVFTTFIIVLFSSMEVGVCAEAYQGGEPLRHINSAFMTFEVLDSDKKPHTLPRIRPEPVVSYSCHIPAAQMQEGLLKVHRL